MPIDEYLPPLVERKKCFKNICGSFKDVWEVLIHGLSGHEVPKNPSKLLPNVDLENSNRFSVCLEIYKAADDRINSIEDKAFKLLTYISALSGIIVFFLSQIENGNLIYLFPVAILFLLVSALLSLRCIGLKTRKEIFISSVFNFDREPPTLNDDKVVAKELLDCAVFNQNIADNTADILKAGRYILMLAFLIASIGFSININKIGNHNSESKEELISFKDSITIKNISGQYEKLNYSLEQLTNIEKRKEQILDSIEIIEKQNLKLGNLNNTVTHSNRH